MVCNRDLRDASSTIPPGKSVIKATEKDWAVFKD